MAFALLDGSVCTCVLPHSMRPCSLNSSFTLVYPGCLVTLALLTIYSGRLFTRLYTNTPGAGRRLLHNLLVAKHTKLPASCCHNVALCSATSGTHVLVESDTYISADQFCLHWRVGACTWAPVQCLLLYPTDTPLSPDCLVRSAVWRHWPCCRGELWAHCCVHHHLLPRCHEVRFEGQRFEK